MVSASSAVRKSMPRISAPICLDNGTTSILAAIATFMFILDGIWQLRRAYLRKMLHCGSLPINYSAKWQGILRPRYGIPGCSQAFETTTIAVSICVPAAGRLLNEGRRLNFEHPWILDIAAKLRLGISLGSWRGRHRASLTLFC